MSRFRIVETFQREVPAVHREPTLRERGLGAYLGLAVGDALGATVEFMTANEVAAVYRVHKDIVGGGWLHLKPGQVTDDTQMSLALGEAILRSGGWDMRLVAEGFVGWLKSKPADVGNTCRRGIRRYMQDGSYCGSPANEDGGNGAAMRNLPVVLSTLDDEKAFEERSLAQGRFTHWHPLSDAGTLALGRITRILMKGGSIAACRAEAERLVAQYPVFKYRPWPGNASGYIVDTVQTVLDAFFETDGFEECVVRAVNRGGDADTTGALAGQIAGALYGVQSIPVRWLRKLDPLVLAKVRDQAGKLLEVRG